MMSITDKAGKTYHYGKLNRNKIRQIVDEHVRKGNAVTELLVHGS
jgi:(2Fe-2S) ferredoxin